jgi:hypothetical protein
MAQGTIEDAGQPHPNVCNGPIVTTGADEPDSGTGALLIAPDPQFDTHGLPVEFSVQLGACGLGFPAGVFAFTTASYRVDIIDADNGSDLLFDTEEGENLSCDQFTEEDGPGRLVFSLGVLHGLVGNGNDAILVFVLDD